MSKKVLHVVSISFSLKYFIGDQFQYFKKKGYSFHVACSEDDELFNLAEQYGFTPFPIPIVRSIDPLRDVKSIIALYNYIRKEKFDIVICHSPKGGLIGITAAYLARTENRVFFRHGLVFETLKGFKRKMLIFIEKLTGALANKVVNVSSSIENIANKLNLNSIHKNILLGNGTCNGVDIHKYMYSKIDRDPQKIVVGFVGRLSKDKGIGELIKAWQILISRWENIDLMLVGPIDERDPLDEEVLRIISDNETIKLVGAVKETYSYYNEMDIFILPSYREGFPTVVLEASSSELPVITTKKTGCIDSIRSGITGIFTDLTPMSIVLSIEFYLENPDKRSEHGKAGRIWMEEGFSESFIYREILNKVLS